MDRADSGSASGKISRPTFAGPGPSSGIASLQVDRERALWIATGNGLFRLKDGTMVRYTTADGLSSNRTLLVHDSPDGQLWVGTQTGLDLYEKEKATFRNVEIVADINAISSDREGNLWIGYYSDGVARFRQGSFVTYTVKDGLSDDQVTFTTHAIPNLKTDNAVKFTPHGEVVVSVHSNLISEGRFELHFAVRDTGIGIPPDKIGLLFRSFSQVDSSTARHYGGTGLGLAISRRLSEMMGGRMWVESEAGQGSTFHFTIQAGEPRSTLIGPLAGSIHNSPAAVS